VKRPRKLLWILLLIPALAGTLAYARYSHVRTNELNQSLLDAIAKSDDARALKLLEQGADPNTREGTPSEHAGLWQMVKELFTGRKNKPNGTGWTALMLSSGRGRPHIVSALIERGALVNATQEDGLTALTATAYTDTPNPDCARLLIEHDADVNTKISSGGTVIGTVLDVLVSMIEIKPFGKNQLAIIRLILPHERSANYRDRTHMKVLCLAIFYNYEDIVKLLLERGTDINGQHPGNTPPAIIAVQTKNPAMLRLLLKYHPDLTLKDGDGTALEQAKQSGNATITELLKNAGAKE
jgi:ankyrin repeat protein